jgi:predicted phage terminase large subunit-like protein
MLEALRKGAAETAAKLDRKANAWRPHEGPQRQFIESTADEVLYGGAVGGGKTIAAVALPIKWIGNPDLRVLILRRRSTDLNDLIDKARKVYKSGKEKGAHAFSPVCPDAEFVTSPKHKATFPSGAVIYFDHCNNPNDWENYQGQEYPVICFEELTQFTEQQYLEIKSRCRSGSPGLPRYIRATTNPGGTGHEWVFRRWRWWMDPKAVIPGREPRTDDIGRPLPPARSGEVLWIVRDEDGNETVSDANDPRATSRTFIPARLEDNPTLLEEDPRYKDKLRDFDPVRRAQLERGDWLVKPAAGSYFRRDWFGPPVDSVPLRVVRVRYWDRAATVPHQRNPDPDWTVGVKLAKDAEGTIYVEDVARIRDVPGNVRRYIVSVAGMDGREVRVRGSLDPGAAGVAEGEDLVRALTGFSAELDRETGDKITRAAPASSHTSPLPGQFVGRVRLVRGAWNEAFVSELESFPDGDHDDQVDAFAGAFRSITPIAAPTGARRDRGNGNGLRGYDEESVPAGLRGYA